MSVVRAEPVSPGIIEAYRGTFASVEPARDLGAEVPPGWEGVLFPFAVPLADLRPDGTPARDRVVPEIDLPRRMYAGETTTFLRPLRVGEDVVQTTSLGEVVEKEGSRGRLVFVDIAREYSVAGEPAIRSVWHDVFLGAGDPDAPPKTPRRDPEAAAGEWSEEVAVDARQLFRFSALTFNTHLVHYDRAWAREVEGLPDLLVHGPLTRVLMMDAARRHVVGRDALRLEMRAIAPVLVDQAVTFVGRTAGDRTRVTAVDSSDGVLATADITWA